MDGAGYTPFGSFREDFNTIFNSDPKILNFLRDAYFASNTMLRDEDFIDKVYKNMLIYNDDIKVNPKWIIGIEQPSETNHQHGITCIYVAPEYRGKGYGSKAIESLKSFANSIRMPIPYLFAVHEDQYSNELDYFYKKNGCKATKNKEYDEIGIGWYRYFWAAPKFNLVFNEETKKTQIGMHSEDIINFLDK